MRCLYYGCIMKAKPPLFADESNVGPERKGSWAWFKVLSRGATMYFSMPYWRKCCLCHLEKYNKDLGEQVIHGKYIPTLSSFSMDLFLCIVPRNFWHLHYIQCRSPFRPVSLNQTGKHLEPQLAVECTECRVSGEHIHIDGCSLNYIFFCFLFLVPS